MRSGCLAVASIASLAASVVSEARADERDFPCDGCVVVGERAEKTSAPSPLLVVLHGDEGGPSRVQTVWSTIAKKKGVVALFPTCPRAEGCTTGSFWRWNGDATWLLDQVRKLEAAYAIDPARRYVAGWSGGTTYLTFQFDKWFPTFAAASLTGGGAPGSRCFPRAGGACAPVLYRMGVKNPLFDLAEGAKDQIAGCGHAVDWKVLPGLDHEGEWRAYAADAESILDWLLSKKESCAAPIAVPSELDAGVSAAPNPSAPPDVAPSTAPVVSGDRSVDAVASGTPIPSTRRPVGCACAMDAAHDEVDAVLAIFVGGALLAAGHRRCRSGRGA